MTNDIDATAFALLEALLKAEQYVRTTSRR
jgi:hypothetical protein